jgi:ATP-dependent Clp protease ATP-binding subunit ClpC
VFERFNEAARQSLFFARYKTAERAGDAITTHDILEGIQLAVPGVVARLSGESFRPSTGETSEQFLARMHADKTVASHASKEIPFAASARTALERAIGEADDLGHKIIKPEHLILALLRDEDSPAYRTLFAAGVTLREARQIISAPQVPGGS